MEIELVNGALNYVSESRDANIAAEAELFNAVGLAHDGKTPRSEVGKVYDPVIAQLKYQQTRLMNCSGGSLSSCVLGSLFGVSLT